MKVKLKAKVEHRRRKGKDGCALVVCVDPKTGFLKVVRAAEGCPKGYMRQVAEAARRGVMLPSADEDE